MEILRKRHAATTVIGEASGKGPSVKPDVDRKVEAIVSREPGQGDGRMKLHLDDAAKESFTVNRTMWEVIKAVGDAAWEEYDKQRVKVDEG